MIEKDDGKESSGNDPSPLEVERKDGVATLRLNRAERRNGIDRALGEELLSELVATAADDSVRAIVITGAGSAFCAGDDIACLSDLLDGRYEATPSFRESRDSYYLRICEEIIRAPKPVVAGVNGAAVGAGLEIACAADYRLASSSARMGSGLSKLGHVGNAVLLPRVVGPARATELFLTGRLVDAVEAERIGLVDRVVPSEDFETELGKLAATLGRGPTRAYGMYKELRERAWSAPVEFGLRLQDVYHSKCLRAYRDGREGPTAYLERRPPVFTGT